MNSILLWINTTKVSRLLFSINILLSISTMHLHGAGFLAGTLVKTPHGYTPIEQLRIHDTVMCYNFDGALLTRPISHLVKKRVNNYLTIFLDDERLCVAPDHLFYLAKEKKWAQAHALTPQHRLLKNTHELLSIDHMHVTHEQADVYDISVVDYHNFCVSRQDIHVHNFVPALVFVGCALGGSTLEFTGITATIGIIGAAFIAWMSRNKGRQQTCASNKSGGQNNYPGTPDDEERRIYPYGIYEDAPYHHQNSNGWKNKAPKNGQEALNNSVKCPKSSKKINTSARRIGISEDEIVVLDETSPGRYHGHVRTWDELEDCMQRALERNGLMKNGKIIK